MKKHMFGRLGASALALTLITTCLMSGTLAKFVTEVNGAATATVASWAFTANGKGTVIDTINLGDTGNRTGYKTGSVKGGVIAPGTTGKFDITLDGSGSEVGIDYVVVISEATGTKLPDDFKVTTEEGETKVDVLNKELKGVIPYSGTENAMKKVITVSWEWPYDADDTPTSNDNGYGGKTWDLDITVTGTQQTPETTAAQVP